MIGVHPICQIYRVRKVDVERLAESRRSFYEGSKDVWALETDSESNSSLLISAQSVAFQSSYIFAKNNDNNVRV
jgi:hypothetical protein